jgi:hypothetical protein
MLTWKVMNDPTNAELHHAIVGQHEAVELSFTRVDQRFDRLEERWNRRFSALENLWSDRTSRNRPPASAASGVEAARSLRSVSLRTGRSHNDVSARVLAFNAVMLSCMKRVERIRLYPTVSQAGRLGFMLHATRHLYNALLQQRRDAYRYRGIAISAKAQYAEITALRHEDPGVAAVYRECQDAVLHRLDLAFTAFFRRVKRGETPGYPRFKAASRWEQLSFPHGDRALKLDAGQRRIRCRASDRSRYVKVGPSRRLDGRGWCGATSGGTRASSASVRCGRYRPTPSSSVSTVGCT